MNTWYVFLYGLIDWHLFDRVEKKEINSWAAWMHSEQLIIIQPNSRLKAFRQLVVDKWLSFPFSVTCSWYSVYRIKSFVRASRVEQTMSWAIQSYIYEAKLFCEERAGGFSAPCLFFVVKWFNYKMLKFLLDVIWTIIRCFNR